MSPKEAKSCNLLTGTFDEPSPELIGKQKVHQPEIFVILMLISNIPELRERREHNSQDIGCLLGWLAWLRVLSYW